MQCYGLEQCQYGDHTVQYSLRAAATCIHGCGHESIGYLLWANTFSLLLWSRFKQAKNNTGAFIGSNLVGAGGLMFRAAKETRGKKSCHEDESEKHRLILYRRMGNIRNKETGPKRHDWIIDWCKIDFYHRFHPNSLAAVDELDTAL